jgi:hypothetical protein
MALDLQSLFGLHVHSCTHWLFLYDSGELTRLIDKCAMKKFCFNCQMRNEPFLIVIYHSSLVKGTMNAARVSKLRNDVKKTPQFLLFSMAKGGTKTNSALVNCGGIEFLKLR